MNVKGSRESLSSPDMVKSFFITITFNIVITGLLIAAFPYMQRIGFDLISFTQLGEVVSLMPVVIKIFNTETPYQMLVGNVYIMNMLMLIGNSVYQLVLMMPQWRYHLLMDLEDLDSSEVLLYLKHVRWWRIVSLVVLVIFSFFLFFDILADFRSEVLLNTMAINRWGGIRLPIITGVILVSGVYLVVTSDINRILAIMSDDRAHELSVGEWDKRWNALLHDKALHTQSGHTQSGWRGRWSRGSRGRQARPRAPNEPQGNGRESSRVPVQEDVSMEVEWEDVNTEASHDQAPQELESIESGEHKERMGLRRSDHRPHGMSMSHQEVIDAWDGQYHDDHPTQDPDTTSDTVLTPDSHDNINIDDTDTDTDTDTDSTDFSDNHSGGFERSDPPLVKSR